MMKNSSLIRTVLVSSAILSAAGLVRAQDASKPNQKQTSAPQLKPAPKPHKVWTEDDLGTIRSRGDITVAAAQTPTIPATADASPSPTAPAKTPGSTKPVGKAALSNPKTAEDAEGMIAWEQRDIDSQQEFVDRLQTELEQAPPDQREHLQKTLAEHRQSLADTRQEQQALIAQKKLLEKKPASETSAASSQSPQ
jgi:hypothetical protein